jgi:hypothetical protein
MLSYSEIIKKAFNITIQKPILWVFGLFMLGGLNLNLFRFLEFDYFSLKIEAVFLQWGKQLLDRPFLFVLLAFGILCLLIVVFVFSNWSRIMLALKVRQALGERPKENEKIYSEAKKALWPVIKISLLTSLLIFAVSVVLLGPPFVFAPSYTYQSFLWNLGVVIFVPLAFTISCLNIFSAFYIVIFKTTFRASLNLCTDFFVVNWTKILGLGIILILFYLATFMIGRSVVFLITLFLQKAVLSSGGFGDLHFSGMILLAKVFTWFLLWLLISGLNVFFNSAFLLLFLEMNKPVKKELKELKFPAPAPESAF